MKWADPVISAVDAGNHGGKDHVTESWQVNKSALAPLSEFTVQSGDIPISNQGGTDMRNVSFILSIMGFALELTVFLMTVAVL